MAVEKKLAEVIAANSNEFTAQCYKLNEAPPLGSLVKTGTDGDGIVFGIVYSIETHSLEPGRRVVIRGDKLDKEEEIYINNPHLEKLMATDFKTLIVGYSETGKLRHYLPPRPPSSHKFVYLCTDNEVKDFSRSLNFLSVLAETKLPVSADEIIAASLRNISQLHSDAQAFIIGAGKELVWILGGDVRRLNAILKRLELGK